MQQSYIKPALPPPSFDLDAPGTYLYTGEASSRGYTLNRFALSLRQPASRAAFLLDETAYMKRFALSPGVSALVVARDWTGLLREGGHLQAILKVAATLGQNLYDIGAHNTGIDRDTLYANCPRRVEGLDELDG